MDFGGKEQERTSGKTTARDELGRVETPRHRERDTGKKRYR
jgi:hypothetical protein